MFISRTGTEHNEEGREEGRSPRRVAPRPFAAVVALTGNTSVVGSEVERCDLHLSSSEVSLPSAVGWLFKIKLLFSLGGSFFFFIEKMEMMR